MERGQMTVPLNRKRRGLESWVSADTECNHTPADAALCLAFAYVWLTEARLDEDVWRAGLAGFDRLQDFVLGDCDGVPKTPRWAAYFTGIPSYTIKALARRVEPQAGHVCAFGSEQELDEVIATAETLGAHSFVSLRPGSGGLPGAVIGGTVYDYETDEVIEGAMVTIRHVPRYGVSHTEKINGAEMRVVTDDFGNFLIDGPESGEYLVFIEKDGYGPRQWGPIEIKDCADPLHFALFFEPEGILWW